MPPVKSYDMYIDTSFSVGVEVSSESRKKLLSLSLNDEGYVVGLGRKRFENYYDVGEATRKWLERMVLTGVLTVHVVDLGGQERYYKVTHFGELVLHGLQQPQLPIRL